MTESIRLKKEGGIVEVLLNRPGAFNAFDLDMIELLAKHLIKSSRKPQAFKPGDEWCPERSVGNPAKPGGH
jgi:hypothetical protein